MAVDNDGKEIVELADKLDDIKEEISETPKEDKDEAWRTQINSSLAAISQALAELKPAQGASPELAALSTKLDAIQTRLDNLELPPKASLEKLEEENLSPETPPVTSSAPPRVPRSVAPKEKPKEPERKAKTWL